MDEALLILNSELPYIVSVYYTSDYCYKVFQHLFCLDSGFSFSLKKKREREREYVQVDLSCIKCYVSSINIYLISNNIIILNNNIKIFNIMYVIYVTNLYACLNGQKWHMLNEYEINTINDSNLPLWQCLISPLPQLGMGRTIFLWWWGHISHWL